MFLTKEMKTLGRKRCILIIDILFYRIKNKNKNKKFKIFNIYLIFLYDNLITYTLTIPMHIYT